MGVTYGSKILLVKFEEKCGMTTQTFKTTEDLLLSVISQYFDEQVGNFDGLPLCHLNVKKKIHVCLDEIMKSYEDEPKEVCPISGATNCNECSDPTQKAECQGENMGNKVINNE